jgi:uncharacterized protein with GYD domain
MLFCITANYTPKALNALMDNPETSRLEAAKQLVEAAGGRVMAMYSTVADGPGAMLIFDVPDPGVAPSISGVIAASGAVQNLRLMRLLSQEEVVNVRKRAAQLRGSYKPADK